MSINIVEKKNSPLSVVTWELRSESWPAVSMSLGADSGDFIIGDSQKNKMDFSMYPCPFKNV